jgi:cytochrome P450
MTSTAALGVPPSSSVGNLPPGVEAHNLISARAAEHARFRKAIGATFSDKVVKVQESIITQYMDLMVGRLRQAVAENAGRCPAVDLVRCLNFITFDIISNLDGTNLSTASRNRITTLGSPSFYNFGLSL